MSSKEAVNQPSSILAAEPEPEADGPQYILQDSDGEEETFERILRQDAEKKKKRRRSTRAQDSDFQRIEYLRKEIAQAISIKNFKECKILNEKLENHIESLFITRLNEQDKKLIENIENQIEHYRGEVSRLRATTKFMIEPIRIQTDDSFEVLRETHIQQLTELEKERQFEIMKNQNVKTGEEVRLEATALNFARLKRYDEADSLQRKCNQLHARNQAEREVNIHKKYDKKEQVLFNRFRMELDLLKVKSDKAVEAVHAHIDDLVNLENKKLNVKCKEFLKSAVNNLLEGDGISDNISRERRVHTHKRLFSSARRIIMQARLEHIVNMNN